MKPDGKQKKTFQFIPALIAVVLLILGAQGCGGGGGGSTTSSAVTTGGITLSLPVGDSSARTAAKIPSTTASIVITVSGDQLTSDITQTVAYPTSGAVSIANIPAGINTLTVEAKDSSGTVLATRTQKLTIIAGVYLDVALTLGFTVSGTSSITPTSISYVVDDAVVIKNNTSSSYSVSIMDGNGTSVGPANMSMGEQGQIKFYPTGATTLTISAGGSATAVVGTGTIDELEAAISASSTYGEAPLSVVLYGTYAAPTSLTGTPSYTWNLGGGSLYSSSYSLTSQQTMATFSSAGDYIVTLTVSLGGQTTTDKIRITVASALPPTVSSVSPTSVTSSSANTITIMGSNFDTGATVTMGSTTLSSTVSSSSYITATVPAGTAAGTYSLTVTNPDGQTSTLASALTVSLSSCPPSGDYWAIGMGGASSYVYSFNGTFSTTAGTLVLTEGSNDGANNMSETYTVSVSANSDGTYSSSIGNGVVIPNNDCSIMVSADRTTGEYNGHIFVKKGASYSTIDPNGKWFLGYIGKTSSEYYVEAGDVTLSNGTMSGTSYYKGSSNSSEQSSTTNYSNVTYTYSTTTGEVVITDAGTGVVYKGGVGVDGNTVIAAPSVTTEQGMIIMVRQPSTFTFSEAYGTWRGLDFSMKYTGGGSDGQGIMITDSTSLVYSGWEFSSTMGYQYESDTVTTSNLTSVFAAGGNTGIALTSFDTYPIRIMVGEGANKMILVETSSTDEAMISFFFKTDQSAPVTTQRPTASAGSDQTAVVGTAITLNGSGTDPDGDTLSYYWETWNSGSNYNISSQSVAQPTVTFNNTGTYNFDLFVYDGQLVSLKDSVTITVSSAP